jgi:colanic acid/amylovoran biosynthesis protein
MRPIFNSARCILLRDERSRQNLLEIGVEDARIHIAADAAFALADPQVLEQAKHRTLPTDRPLHIAISVSHWPHFKGMTTAQGMERYLNVMGDITRWLVNDFKAEVAFLSTCQGNPEYQDDSEIACRVVERLAPSVASRVTVVREFVRFDALLERLPAFDLVLATRMHMAILSLMAGTPAIPLALEFKTNELYANLGLADWVLNVEQFDSASARRKISDFLAHLPGLRAGLFSRVEQQRATALEGGRQLRDLLNTFSAGKDPI